MKTINSFSGENEYLSNFYEIPVKYDGLIYLNNESAFQAQKCRDKKDREKFTTLNPTEAKKLGRSVFLRSDWENVKVGIMKDIVFAKFEQNKELQEKLMSTGDCYLEEGNTWNDKVWGTVNGVGRNLLGEILMDVRTSLIKQYDSDISDNFSER